MFCLILLFIGVLNAQNQPNILLILVDDLGNADASFNFRLTNPSLPEPIMTPNIDAIAEKGIIFRNHYTQTICGPSRCALLTSRYPYRLGNPFPSITGNDPMNPDSFGAGDLGSGWRTFVHELSDRNYRNHMIGKYGVDNHNRSFNNSEWVPHIQPKPLNPSHHKLGPLSRGFDTFYGLYGSAHNHFTKVLDYNGVPDWHLFNETHILDAPHLDVEPTLSSTHLFTRETINILQQHVESKQKQPFFVYLSYSMPHDPLLVDDVYISDKFPHCASKPYHRRKLYCGMVACVDEGIGNITAFMKQNHLMDNTIIIFSSDNGGFPNVGGYNYPYRGAKGALFEGGVRTPSFIYAPFLFKNTSGTVFDGLIHLVDWGPTLLSMVDGNVKSNRMGDIDGIDLSTILKSKGFSNKNAAVRTDIILNANRWTNSTSFLYGDYKMILGFNGGDVLWNEPDGIWPVPADDMIIDYYVPAIWNHLIQLVLGSDYWFFEWSFIAVMSRLQDYVRAPYVCNSPVLRHPDGIAKGFVDPRPLWMPIVIDWGDEYQRLCKIRLYNIKEDQSESNNIALENKEKVEEMLAILNQRLEKDAAVLDLASGLQYGLYNTFVKAVMLMLSIIIAVVVGMVSVLCYCCGCCCFNRAKVVVKRKNNKKRRSRKKKKKKRK